MEALARMFNAADKTHPRKIEKKDPKRAPGGTWSSGALAIPGRGQPSQPYAPGRPPCRRPPPVSGSTRKTTTAAASSDLAMEGSLTLQAKQWLRAGVDGDGAEEARDPDAEQNTGTIARTGCKSNSTSSKQGLYFLSEGCPYFPD